MNKIRVASIGSGDLRSLFGHVTFFVTLSLVGEFGKGAERMQEEKTVENKANYIDGGNFKTRIGNTTYLVGVFYNNAKKVTVEDRMKNLIRQEVVAGNF